ncbi:uncharacterized protein IWZ02DRAFT_280320 [Phyllosticta citriasiana]|uniref:uncharacterized protein n=1 Tax=Phyllosticta citriasiana TaxID=595635 RepID=UPI0030FD4349
MSRLFWLLGSLSGASGVALGAFGAHGLKNRVKDPAKLQSWGTAAHYQLIHSATLLLATHAAPQNRLAMGLFGAGITLFSGSIYLLVLWPERFRKLGPLTPVGGVCLIAGWVALAVGRRGVPLGAR